MLSWTDMWTLTWQSSTLSFWFTGWLENKSSPKLQVSCTLHQMFREVFCGFYCNHFSLHPYKSSTACGIPTAWCYHHHHHLIKHNCFIEYFSNPVLAKNYWAKLFYGAFWLFHWCKHTPCRMVPSQFAVAVEHFIFDLHKIWNFIINSYIQNKWIGI